MPLVARPGGIDEKSFQLGVSWPQLGPTRAGDVTRLRGALKGRMRALNVSEGTDGIFNIANEVRALWRQCQETWRSKVHHQSALEWYEYSEEARHAYDVVEATRSDSTESVLIVFPLRYRSAAEIDAACLSLSIGHGLAWHLQEQEWLAKNVVFLYVDASRYSVHGAIEEWTRLVLDESFDRRVGQVQQAVVWDVSMSPATQGTPKGAATIKIHGWYGQLPNLDLFMASRKSIMVHGGATLEAMVHGASTSSPMILKSMSLFRFVLSHALGIADGCHAELLERGIDALTVEFSPHGPASATAVNDILQVVESTVRALNNLEEKLHHATGMYALAGPTALIEVSMFMACAALLLLCMGLRGVRLLHNLPPLQSIDWNKSIGAAVLILTMATFLLHNVQNILKFRLVSREQMRARMATEMALRSVHLACSTVVLGVLAWKFIYNLVRISLPSSRGFNSESDVTSNSTTRSDNLAGVRAALQVLVLSVCLCLLLWRWSLSWLILSAVAIA